MFIAGTALALSLTRQADAGVPWIAFSLGLLVLTEREAARHGD